MGLSLLVTIERTSGATVMLRLISTLFFFCVGLFIALVVSLENQAQAQVKAIAVAPVGDTPNEKAKIASAEFITFPADRDAQQFLEAAQSYIKEAKAENEKWDRICDATQRVLDMKNDSFFEIEEVIEGEKKKSRISVRVHANNLIANFKPAGRQFYQIQFGPQAQTLLEEAIKENYDRTKLSVVSQRYFHTKAGGEATLLLAGIYLDRGQFLEASYAYDRFINRPDTKDISPRVLYKASLAAKRAGDPMNIKRADDLWTKFSKVIPRDGLNFSNKMFSAEELKAEYDRVSGLDARITDSSVTQRMGNLSHTLLNDGGTVYLDPTFSLPLVYSATEPGVDENSRAMMGFEWARQNLSLSLRKMSNQKVTDYLGVLSVQQPRRFDLSQLQWRHVCRCESRSDWQSRAKAR
jgi:tetratricopeptide (TPR) repeat protein